MEYTIGMIEHTEAYKNNFELPEGEKKAELKDLLTGFRSEDKNAQLTIPTELQEQVNHLNLNSNHEIKVEV